MDKVSVITPVYRVERYIEECIQSVLSQTYQNIEFILVDDCGGDRSVDIINDLIKQNTTPIEIRLISHTENKGVSAARNTALKAATGDYIFCLDSDDRLLPNSITTLVTKAVQTKADIVMCCHSSEGDAQNRGGMMCAPVNEVNGTTEILDAFANQWFNVAPWCKLFKHSFIVDNQLYFYEGIINEDNPWTFQLCLKAQKIVFVHKELYFYRYNGNSIMSNSKKDDIIKSNEIAVSIYLSEIRNHVSLWYNKAIYIIYMRQVVNYYTLMFLYGRPDECKCNIRLLKNMKYNTYYFSPIAKSIPFYYRLWNFAFKLPNMFLYVYLKSIINLQRAL